MKELSAAPSVVSTLRDAPKTTRGITFGSIFFFLWIQFYPGILAAKEELEKPARPAAQTNKQDEHGKTLESIVENLKVLEPGQKAQPKDKTAAAARAELKQLRQKLIALDKEALKEFDANEAHIKKHKLSSVIMKRHQDAVVKFKKESTHVQNKLLTLEADPLGLTAKDLRTHLEGMPTGRKHQPFDPKNLPFRTPDGKVREPKMTKEEYAELFPEKSVMLASAGSLSGLGILAGAAALAPPTEADLAPTEDVQITDAIRAKATELHNHPVEIYNWVHNNVEYIPTYGSIQGSDMTLQTLRGNGFDTASLLIALLRVSNIPSRYVYGTIEVPADKVMNWVGGVEVPEAAQQLLGQGGIPNTGIRSGGKITTIRMEHVWVEAYVDYHPSRGAKNIAPDTWVPLDASFKEYHIVRGVSAADLIEVDPVEIENRLLETADFRPSEGSIRNINAPYLDAVIKDVKEDLISAITDAHPNPSRETFVGSRLIRETTSPTLQASAPFKVVAAGSRMSELPSSLRNGLRIEGPSGVHFTSGLSTLVGRRITISYKPATSDDQATVDRYGGVYRTPPYLVNVKAQLKIDGAVLAESSPISLATREEYAITFIEPNRYPDTFLNVFTSGGYYALAVVPGKLNSNFGSYLGRRGGALDAYYAAGGALDSDEGLGEQLYLSGLSYFWVQDLNSEILSSEQGVALERAPSEAIFGLSLAQSESYGIPKSLELTGTFVDVDRAIYVGTTLDGSAGFSEFLVDLGSLGSATEHLVIEELYNTSAISAVKFMQVANQSGQTLYEITSENVAVVMPKLHVPADVKSNIQDAVYAGKHVNIPESEMTIMDWSGVGYIVTDPATGAAAYLISGGIDGGAEMRAQGPTLDNYPKLSNFFDFTTCIILDAVDNIVELVGLVFLRKHIIKRFRVMFGMAASYMFWIGVILIAIVILAAIIDCMYSSVGDRFRGKDRLVYA